MKVAAGQLLIHLPGLIVSAFQHLELLRQLRDDVRRLSEGLVTAQTRSLAAAKGHELELRRVYGIAAILFRCPPLGTEDLDILAKHVWIPVQSVKRGYAVCALGYQDWERAVRTASSWKNGVAVSFAT